MKPILLLFYLFCLSANAQQKFTVYFDTGAAEATTSSLGKFQEWVMANPDIDIETVNGYTDKTGKSEYNQQLSEKRTAYVYALLKASDVNLDYAIKNAYGEEQSTAYDHSPDRKVEINYVKAEYSKPQQSADTTLKKEIVNAKVGDIIILRNMLFYGGTTYVLPESRPILKELLAIMLSHPKLKIDIQGHICCDVDDSGNLSGRRAQEVESYLINNGVDKKRVTTKGFGGRRPIYDIPEWSDEQRYANRRVEIEILSN
ncbi:OmpA family protein [Flavobacterium sp. AG291]|uniref:OmpA family protein n=1 Tax=Flavobacterium sp. AG291 TaxID=2184000 RepID=UPI000E2A4551|nr:OmpA family protein [Flavobacterium sp. AG291]RDI05644.1 outer membrane protein OmpA-like peptidoglycan-associated protein [Flavobacterium sp. AG291]